MEDKLFGKVQTPCSFFVKLQGRRNRFLFCSLSFYQAVAKMVQECYKYVDTVTDQPIKLRLIDTLRTVTAGKVCVIKQSGILETHGKLYRCKPLSN